MTNDRSGDGVRSTSGRLSSDKDRPAEAASGAPDAVSPFDPELSDDLGAEFELRGDQMEGALEEARAEADAWKDRAARAQADFENTRKRLEARHADALLRAGERIVEALLPVIDDMDRAIEHAEAGGADVTEGLVAVRRKLIDVLVREGCSAIEPMGEPFDPDKHSAVQMREDTELTDHTVCEVFQKGYEMHGRILRPAMVVVSTGGPARK